METYVCLIYDHFKLFIGYTYTDANTHFAPGKSWLPLTVRHRLNNVLMYEIEDKLKLGLKAYYFSPQRLNDGALGRSYWITDFMAEQVWEHLSMFINFENFTNTRQTRFDTIYTGSSCSTNLLGKYQIASGVELSLYRHLLSGNGITAP